MPSTIAPRLMYFIELLFLLLIQSLIYVFTVYYLIKSTCLVDNISRIYVRINECDKECADSRDENWVDYSTSWSK
jgi:hypothetical protein